MRRQLLTGLKMTAVLTLLLGLAYPLAVTVVSQAAFPSRADGSLVRRDGRVVGSALLGQAFSRDDGSPDPGYFQPRPSAAGAGYDALGSGGSNLGPSSEKLLTTVKERVAAYRAFNGLAAGAPVPVDAVTASASGLDPDISVANARLQAARVANARGLAVAQILALIGQHTQERPFGVLGEKRVNVLRLNLALDDTI